MSLLTEKSADELNRDFLDSLLIESAAALNHAAAVIRNANVIFWSEPPERILAILNADVPRSLLILQTNSSVASAVNGQLDQFGERFPARIQTTMGRDDIAFDQALGQFVWTPVEVEEHVVTNPPFPS